MAVAIVGVVQMTGSALYGIGVGHLADGSAVPMATAIASAGLAVAFALLRRRGGAAMPAPPGGGAGSELPK